MMRVKQITRGGWSGLGMATVGIDPNTFEVFNDHPTKIPTDIILGDVVQNCRPVADVSGGKRFSMSVSPSPIIPRA